MSAALMMMARLRGGSDQGSQGSRRLSPLAARLATFPARPR